MRAGGPMSGVDGGPSAKLLDDRASAPLPPPPPNSHAPTPEGAKPSRARLISPISLGVNAQAAAITGKSAPGSSGGSINQRSSTLRRYSISAPPPFSCRLTRSCNARRRFSSSLRASSNVRIDSRAPFRASSTGESPREARRGRRGLPECCSGMRGDGRCYRRWEGRPVVQN